MRSIWDELIEGWEERLDKFIEEVGPVYEERPGGMGGFQTPNSEQEERIKPILKKWAKNEAEEGWFRENARQRWVAW